MAHTGLPFEKRVLSLHEFALWAGIGLAKAREEIRTGRLHAVRVGMRIRVTGEAALRWVNSLPAASSYYDDEATQVERPSGSFH